LDRGLMIAMNTNLVNRRGFHQDMWLLGESIIHAQAGFTAGPMCVTWQETHEHTEEGLIPFYQYGLSLPYDESRIEIIVQDESPIPISAHSEVFYGLYLRKCRTYGQDYALVALKRRLGRSVAEGKRPVQKAFAHFCSTVHFPSLDVEHEDGVVDEAVYRSYLDKMPAASRDKHWSYFLERQRVNSNLEPPRFSAFFVKFDEVLIDAKGRLIINPSPWLFYSLVVWTTAVKKALKRNMFHLVYANKSREVFFTYGADLDSALKSLWFTRAVEKIVAASFPTFCVLVGGDDNLCLFGCNGEVHSWESDVSACDQSHNRHLVEPMLDVFADMGVSSEALEVWRASYLTPLKGKKRYEVHFKKYQLHTGDPHTSLCNTFLVGLMAIYFCVHNPDLSGLNFVAWTSKMANKLGMEWKVQFNDNPLDSTFHKGFWVPCAHEAYGFQWLPLPSCIWKAMKIRTDSYVGHRELLMRLAFNQYQRVVAPNCMLVREMCRRQFEYIFTKLDLFHFAQARKEGILDRDINIIEFVESVWQKQGSSFQRYREKQQIGKGGDLALETAMDWEQEPWWDLDAERDFCLRRYGSGTDDFRAFCDSWTGEFGIFVGLDFERMIIRDYGVDGEGFEARCEEELLLVREDDEF